MFNSIIFASALTSFELLASFSVYVAQGYCKIITAVVFGLVAISISIYNVGMDNALVSALAGVLTVLVSFALSLVMERISEKFGTGGATGSEGTEGSEGQLLPL